MPHWWQLLPGRQRLTWHLVQGQVASPPLPVTAPGKPSICGNRHHSGKKLASLPQLVGTADRAGQEAGGRPACAAWPVFISLSRVQHFI